MIILGAERIEVTLNFVSGLALFWKYDGQYRRVQFLPFLSTLKRFFYTMFCFSNIVAWQPRLPPWHLRMIVKLVYSLFNTG